VRLKKKKTQKNLMYEIVCGDCQYYKVWKSRRIRQEGMWHAWERNELHLQFWLGNLKGKNLHFDHRQILKWILRKQDGKAQNGFEFQ